MKLLLDHHYSPEIARRVRGKGHDVDAAAERGWQAEPDERLLALCAEERRALLTNDVRDLTVLAREWSATGRVHAGLVFTADAGLPRTRRTIGRYVTVLDRLLRAHPAADALAGRTYWL